MRTLMQDRKTGERLEITGARNLDGHVEIVLGDEDDYGTPDEIRERYKRAEPRRLRIAVTEHIEVELDEAKLRRYFGEIPTDSRLRQWAGDEPFYDGMQSLRRALEDFLPADDHRGVESDFATKAETETKCARHNAWRFPDDGSGLSCNGSCYQCEQEERARLAATLAPHLRPEVER